MKTSTRRATNELSVRERGVRDGIAKLIDRNLLSDPEYLEGCMEGMAIWEEVISCPYDHCAQNHCCNHGRSNSPPLDEMLAIEAIDQTKQVTSHIPYARPSLSDLEWAT